MPWLILLRTEFCLTHTRLSINICLYKWTLNSQPTMYRHDVGRRWMYFLFAFPPFPILYLSADCISSLSFPVEGDSKRGKFPLDFYLKIRIFPMIVITEESNHVSSNWMVILFGVINYFLYLSLSTSVLDCFWTIPVVNAFIHLWFFCLFPKCIIGKNV